MINYKCTWLLSFFFVISLRNKCRD